MHGLRDEEKVQRNYEIYQEAYKKLKNTHYKGNLISQSLWITYKKKIIVTTVLFFFSLVLNIAQMLMMAQLMSALSEKNIRENNWGPLILGLIELYLISTLSLMTYTSWDFESNVLIVEIQGALSLKLFKKTFSYPIIRS